MITYKKLLFALIGTAGIAFTSCSSDNEDLTTNEPQMVNVKLDFTFEQSGDMTRASGAETYAAFYEKYIKTKQLTPKNYSLEFRKKETDELILSKNGIWSSEEGLQLPEGTYRVSGTSYPKEKYSDSPSDTVYIHFDEEVEITKSTTQLTLTAKYQSYLLLFDASNIEEIRLDDGSSANRDRMLSKDENCYWLFMCSNYYYNSYAYYYKFYIDLNNSNTVNLYTGTQSYSHGKYYFYQYNDISNGYNIPEMQPGN